VDDAVYTAALEAQFLMGHAPANAHVGLDRETIENWSWDVDQVRQALYVPLNAVWEERVLELEMQGLASWCCYAQPVTYDDQGTAHEIPSWQDTLPLGEWGSWSIHPAGVLKLATLYGRPYVRLAESPAVHAHWDVVQRESAARAQEPYDPEQWEREWPERARAFFARYPRWPPTEETP
jgi:hypothetical protein